MPPWFATIAPWWLQTDAREYYRRSFTRPAHAIIYVASVCAMLILGVMLLAFAPDAAASVFRHSIIGDVAVAGSIVILLVCDRALTRDWTMWGFNLVSIPLMFGTLYLSRETLLPVVLCALMIGGVLSRISPWRLIFMSGSWLLLLGGVASAERVMISPHILSSPLFALGLVAIAMMCNFWLSGTSVLSYWVLGVSGRPSGVDLSAAVVLSTLIVAGLSLGWIALAVTAPEQTWWGVTALAFIIWLAWWRTQDSNSQKGVEAAYKVISVWRTATSPDEVVTQCLRGWRTQWDCEEIRCYLTDFGRRAQVDEYSITNTGEVSHYVRRTVQSAGRDVYQLAHNEEEARLLSVDSEPFMKAMGWTQALDLPLRHGDQFLGRLVIARKHYDRIPWRDADIPTWRTLQQLLSAAIFASKTSNDLEWSALHDNLTRLPNAVMFDQLLEAALQNGSHPGLLFFDINNFKQVNDLLGHDTGDRVLSIVGWRLRNHVKSDDIVARLHGDEFVALLLNIDSIDDAFSAANRVHRNIAELTSLPWPADSIKVSIGGLVNIDSQAHAVDVLRYASHAMYGCKHGDGVTPNIVEYSAAVAAAQLQLAAQVN